MTRIFFADRVRLIFFVLATLLFVVFPCFSQATNLDSWRLLDQAQRQYELGNISQSFKLAQTAKELRTSEVQKKLDTLQSAIIPLAVQNAGDNVTAVRNLLIDRMETSAVAVIDEQLLFYSDFFDSSSISSLYDHLAGQRLYPEAEYLLGKLFVQEGEYRTALNYYLEAYSHSGALDIPDVKTDILYDIAYLSNLVGDQNQMEEALLTVMQGNPDFVGSDGDTPYVDIAMNYAKKGEGVDAQKFFLLYRSGYYRSINASVQLASFYDQSGYPEQAFRMACLSSLGVFTRIYSVLTQRSQKFSFTTLDAFFADAVKHSDIVEWLKNNDGWKGFELFAKYASFYGNQALSLDLYNALAQYSKDSRIKESSKRVLGK